ALDVADVFDGTADLGFLKGKIVLMGFLGENFEKPSLEDVFFTPLNERYAGKSYPDMHGVVIHANAVSMALRGDYIEQMPDWLMWLSAIAICFINVAGLSYIFKNYNTWFGGETMIFQLLEMVALMFCVVVVFANFRYKLDFTLAMFCVALSSTVLDIYYSMIEPRISGFKSADFNDNFKKIYLFKKRFKRNIKAHQPEELN
ncbi:MAG TPA: CHASE2 domain-containing protein, partial [Patescibacteria group bacterium]|nr:CHASE2 domain-containing protein [Patescibacteria group bacterium]